MKKDLQNLIDLLRYTKINKRATALNKDIKDFYLEIIKEQYRPYKIMYKNKILFYFETVEELKAKLLAEINAKQAA